MDSGRAPKRRSSLRKDVDSFRYALDSEIVNDNSFAVRSLANALDSEAEGKRAKTIDTPSPVSDLSPMWNRAQSTRINEQIRHSSPDFVAVNEPRLASPMPNYGGDDASAFLPQGGGEDVGEDVERFNEPANGYNVGNAFNNNNRPEINGLETPQRTTSQSPSDTPRRTNHTSTRTEPLPPIVFNVPVSEFPGIEWKTDVDLEALQEIVESESDSESDAGSVADMIDDSSDESEEDGNKDYVPEDVQNSNLNSNSDESNSDSDSDDGDFHSSEAEISENEIVTGETVAEARKKRPKRNRIPTLDFGTGERILYEARGQRELLTAVDVRRVEEPPKIIRRRRRRRRPQVTIPPGDDTIGDIHAPVYDTSNQVWQDQTVVRSLQNFEFQPILDVHGEIIQGVERHITFGTATSPIRNYVLKISPGASFEARAEDSKAYTFVVWKGTCDVSINEKEFVISSGKACLAPRGNDLSAKNDEDSDLFLFVTEVGDEKTAEAMERDAQSLLSLYGPIDNDQPSEIPMEIPNDFPSDVPSEPEPQYEQQPEPQYEPQYEPQHEPQHEPEPQLPESPVKLSRSFTKAMNSAINNTTQAVPVLGDFAAALESDDGSDGVKAFGDRTPEHSSNSIFGTPPNQAHMIRIEIPDLPPPAKNLEVSDESLARILKSN